ncbi:Uncharacterised protein [Yersinia pseudotuberculosis]|nr:Uncharacterised protein [Yersinia pseudotuberculosis]
MLTTMFFTNPFQVNNVSLERSEDSHQHTKVEIYYELLGKNNVTICTTENLDRKSHDYFDSKKHEISYNDKKHGDIKLTISGRGRHEDIVIFKSGTKLDVPEYVERNILSMNGTFSHNEMHVLEGIISKKKGRGKEVFPYVELNENEVKHGASTSSKDFKSLIDFRLKRNPQVKEILIPVLSNKDHWYAIHIEIDKDSNNLTPTIINTTNEAKVKDSYDCILNGYKKIQSLLGEMFKESEIFHDFNIGDFKFCQSLQYGNMGCGITTNLNEQAILNGKMEIDDLAFTKESFRTNEQVLEMSNIDVFSEGKKYVFFGKKAELAKRFTELLGDDCIPSIMLKQEHYGENDFNNDIGAFFNGDLEIKQVELSINIPPYLIKDKSQRSNLAIESIRRADLALNYLERMEKKNAVLTEILHYKF